MSDLKGRLRDILWVALGGVIASAIIMIRNDLGPTARVIGSNSIIQLASKNSPACDKAELSTVFRLHIKTGFFDSVNSQQTCSILLHSCFAIAQQQGTSETDNGAPGALENFVPQRSTADDGTNYGTPLDIHILPTDWKSSGKSIEPILLEIILDDPGMTFLQRPMDVASGSTDSEFAVRAGDSGANMFDCRTPIAKDTYQPSSSVVKVRIIHQAKDTWGGLNIWVLNNAANGLHLPLGIDPKVHNGGT
jgi:hypothetical protein